MLLAKSVILTQKPLQKPTSSISCESYHQPSTDRSCKINVRTESGLALDEKSKQRLTKAESLLFHHNAICVNLCQNNSFQVLNDIP